ncbi:MAG: leucyl/phenylalanyl-tRNA--protein transferase [Hyphomicrobiales bacterium]
MDSNATLKITPNVLLKAYACGIFPMSEGAEDKGLFWVEPEERGILPLNEFHIPRSLRKTVRNTAYRVVVNQNFAGVVEGCAASKTGREVTWINAEIKKLYTGLYDMGQCHTVEVYDEEKLIGGLYGVQLGSAFFGESMFSHATDTSKIALVHLVARLIAGGFSLLDTQFTTEHLEKFGAREIPRARYHLLLDTAIRNHTDYHMVGDSMTGTQTLEIIDSFQN